MSDVINGVPRELLERVAKPVETQYDRDQRWKALDELRALLTAQPQASAAQSAPDSALRISEIGQRMQRDVMPGSASDVWGKELVLIAEQLSSQSAPAGEREAFEARYSVPDGISWSGASYGPVGRQHQLSPAVFVGLCGQAARLDAQLEAFQAGAAWQRTQSAGVPEGWKWVPVEPTPEMIQAAMDKPCFDPLGDLLPWSHITRTSYAAMLAAAPAQPAAQREQQLCPVCDGKGEIHHPHAHDEYRCESCDGCGTVEKAAAQDQGEVQRLRQALASCRDELRNMIDKHNSRDPSDGSWLYDHQTVAEADAALAASTGQEVES